MSKILKKSRLFTSQNMNKWTKIQTEQIVQNKNTNRAEGRGANACLFYLTSLSNFIVTARGLM